ncbi:MAG: hydrogenase 4 subunit F [Candidatus Vogelbacteria bacterium]|nr:hydrogenase 4 subunit F [Candidatus Vogelbacteria bacterium]
MEIIVIISGLCIAAIASFVFTERAIVESLSILASAVSFIFSVEIGTKVAAVGSYDPTYLFSVNSMSAVVLMIVSFVGLVVTIYSVAYLREETGKGVIGISRVRQYFILLNLFLVTMILAITVNSPIFAWIAIEATTLSTAFLISFYNNPSAMEAAWKYLVINSVGLLLAFFGTLLYFTSMGSVGGAIIGWQTLVANAINLNPLIVKTAFIFVLVGYGTKVGLAPMHTWLPDAHSKAPAPVSALLSGVLLNVALVTVLRFKVITDSVVGGAFSQNLLVTFGVLSILIAAFIILTQKDFKRLLAYSSIENMGIMSLGFGFGGLGIFAATLHLIYHALLKSAMFLSAGTIYLRYGTTRISEVRGAIKALPITGLVFLTGFFAITGTPPFGVFLTKIYILSAGIISYPLISAVVLLLLAIMFVGFFKHTTSMVFGDKPEAVLNGEDNIWLTIPPLLLILIVLFLSFHLPSFIYTLLNSIALHY